MSARATGTRARTEPATGDGRLAEIVDTAALRGSLEAIARKGAERDVETRAAVLELLRETNAAGRKAAEAMLFADGGGLACAMRISLLQDALVAAVHDFARRHVANGAGEPMAIVAVGGYGRGTLAPGSDIDLLFLLPDKGAARGDAVAEYLLYLLWDLGFKVGHATRTVEECVRLARTDHTIRTAILERRLVAGERSLFAELGTRFETEVVAGTSAEFIRAKLEERDARHARLGDTRYLVEPNVKEGKGGLRDLHTLFWIAKDHYRVETREDLTGAGVFSRREARIFAKAEDFLWAVRCHMHFATGKAEERLSFDLQPEIAERLGYNAHPGLKDVERFMKHYFLIAKDVGDLTGILCAALEEQQAKEAPGVLRGLVRSLRARSRQIPGTLAFAIDNGRIVATGRNVFAADPVNLIRVFQLAAHHGLEYHPDTLKLVRRSLRLVDGPLRENREANSLFLDVLTDRRNPELHLRRMNEAGVLGRFIPDFGKIVAMMQFNMYHHYTVDEHLLRSIAVLSRLERGDLAGEMPLTSGFVGALRDRVPLYVALLLHDIAKGRPEDHSVGGERIARELCPRFGLDERETELVAWLVRDHLVMSMVAQQRDLTDRRTIRDFAERVQTLDRLKMLAVLTVCDIRAVGPGVWNGWKGQLIRTLYMETEPVLTGGFAQGARNERAARARAELEAGLDDWPAAERDAVIERHYPNYFLTVALEDQKRHAAFVRDHREAGDLATQVRTDRFRGMTEITVLAPDHPRLLSFIAGGCAATGANIADAQIFTMTDGRALDVVTVNREFAEDEDELRRAERIARNIRSLLGGREKMPALLASRRSRGRDTSSFHVAPSVLVANDLSDRLSVIEVEGLDRIGLLSDLTGAISDLNLDIRSAHISTYGEKVVDVFYVTDLLGMKVTGESRAERIERRLLSVFESPEGEASSAAAMPSTVAFGMSVR